MVVSYWIFSTSTSKQVNQSLLCPFGKGGMFMTQNKLRVDGVFEGGGVTGIGLVGAVSVIEAAGYEFVNLAGTSAGGVVGKLFASGSNAGEKKRTLHEKHFRAF